MDGWGASLVNHTLNEFATFTVSIGASLAPGYGNMLTTEGHAILDGMANAAGLTWVPRPKVPEVLGVTYAYGSPQELRDDPDSYGPGDRYGLWKVGSQAGCTGWEHSTVTG
jgi:hypothetical protein